jgi:formamidopyrimidine-DNA glycosylase
MPELPEVETIVTELKTKVLKRTFVGLWTDSGKIIKKPGLKDFKKQIKGKKILNVWRRGKNIIFDLSGKKKLLIHQKLTGHLLFGKWIFKNKKWESLKNSPLSKDPANGFIRLMFFLDKEKMLALSDLRKFAKVELWEEKDLLTSKNFSLLGPEPLEKSFSFEKFKKTILKSKGKIKQVLMDQNIIVGIGNIYSDEILFAARINPLRKVEELKGSELKMIYMEMKRILKKAIKVKGESFSDFRTLFGEKGGFDPFRKVYRRDGEKCFFCKNIIKKIKIGGRSSRFCPKCQK